MEKRIPVKVLANGKITLPKMFREDLQIKDGEVLKVVKDGNKLIIEKY